MSNLAYDQDEEDNGLNDQYNNRKMWFLTN